MKNLKKQFHKKNSKLIIILCISFLFLTQTTKPEKEISIETYFCYSTNCSEILEDLIKESENSIKCAFYDLNLENIKNLLLDNKAQIIIDDRYIKNLPFKTDNKPSYMHNKFCIFDEKIVFTGSMNPTYNDAYKNENNILVIHSKEVSKIYLDEFKEMYEDNIFSAGTKTNNPFFKTNNLTIATFFCPEDNCITKIAKILDSAKESIYFMHFSFTHELISSILTNKKIEIKGIFDNRLVNGLNSQYQYLLKNNISVKINKKRTIHHKVFIIDNETVITGSMNPSVNGNTKNDENIIIIKNKEIAKKYLEEFMRIYY